MSNNTKSYLNRKSIIGIASGSVVVIALVLIFAPFNIVEDKTDVTKTQAENNPSVAEVNGQKITLTEIRNLIKTQMLQGRQLDMQSAMDIAVTKTVLLDEAKERNIVVTTAEADDELAKNFAQNGLSKQEFEERLEQVDTTYDQILKSFREQMIINKVVADELSNTDIQVNDDEAKDFFDDNIDAIKMQVGNNTVFDDVSSQIKATIMQQKQQQVISDFVEELKGNATIITYGTNP